MTDYIGVFSWKFPYKTQLSKDHIYHLIKDEDIDIISFCHQIPTYLKFTEKVHPGFMPLFTNLCDHLDLKVAEPKCVIYSNFFVAKTAVYKAYIEGCVKPAIEWMEGRKDVWKDTTYKGLSKEDLKKFTGLDYYPFHVFLIERLISVYIDNKELSWKVKNKII